ncbi:hypothetical protein B0H16DRAFT_1480563 [Mycena metata]|uniref:Uncharacterized protein n=1 Tax=Mycena metata TaxID=1033252 RepID=A0AAD7MCV6_9AGAR|nr:hypothetical protein B0H16DRAFT_1480563 [Mycena metata]
MFVVNTLLYLADPQLSTPQRPQAKTKKSARWGFLHLCNNPTTEHSQHFILHNSWPKILTAGDDMQKKIKKIQRHEQVEVPITTNVIAYKVQSYRSFNNITLTGGAVNHNLDQIVVFFKALTFGYTGLGGQEIWEIRLHLGITLLQVRIMHRSTKVEGYCGKLGQMDLRYWRWEAEGSERDSVHMGAYA